MNLVELAKSNLFHALECSGTGMKVLLMDKDTTSMISVACPQSEIMKHEVYLFEQIENRNECQRLRFLKCIAIVRPTDENVMKIATELKFPRYCAYYLYFTNTISRNNVKRLAEADSSELVKDLREIFLDFYAINTHVYSLGLGQPIRNFEWSKAGLERSVDGIVSLLISMKCEADICVQRSSNLAGELANGLQQELNALSSKETFKPVRRSTVLIIDRRLDSITPLLNQWTYQAMLHELIGINNNVLDLSGRPDVPPDLTKVTLSTETDEFFRNNMYCNFGEIGSTIKVLVDEYQKQVKSHQKIESIGDIKNFVSSYPEFKKMSGTVTKHVALVSELSNIVGQHRLLQVSEFEQDIVCGSDTSVSNHLERLYSILESPDLKQIDALRLVLLLSLRYEDLKLHLENISKRMNVKSIILYKMIEELRKYSDSKRLQEIFKPTMTTKSQKLFKELRGIENVYTRHQPYLREIVSDLLKGRIRQNEFKQVGSCGSKKVLVFVIGGVTYEEAHTVYQLNKELQSEVFIGGTAVLNTQKFIDDIRFVCSKE